MRKNGLLVFVVFLSIVVVCVTGSGNSCLVDYKTIHEWVPYCGASSWLHWDCLNKCTDLSTQFNNITRLRALCCSGGRDCFEECHHPKDYDKETQYCGDVCPLFFTSSPPSTASTRGSILTTQMSSNSTQSKHENGEFTF